MAVVRSRSASQTPLIVTGAVAAMFLIAAIAMYIVWSKSTADADANQASLDKATQSLTQAKAENQNLLAIIGGANAPSTVEAIKNDTAIKPILERNISLRDALQSLAQDRDEKAKALTDANQRAVSATTDAANAQKALQERIDGDQKTISDLGEQLKNVNAQLATTDQARDTSVKEGIDNLDASRKQAEADRRKLVLENQDLLSKIGGLQHDVQQLRDALSVARNGDKANSQVGEPDGTVLHYNAAAGEVYISLTAKDHVKAGMTFTCYDPQLGVRYGTDEQAKGNGTIEVTQIGSESSICRITSTTPGHAIQTGDLISNIVYHNDKSRKYHFVVYGDFDLDGDGVATAAERDRLISMINTYGGQVDDQVTAQTDYVVMGTRPAAPTIIEDNSAATPAATAPADAAAATPTDAAASAPAGSVTDQRSKDDLRYDQIVTEAKDLGIPVLNANRFLALIGYYSTTIVRY